MVAKKVSTFNSDGTNQRATVIVGMGFRGADGELYVVDGDQTTGGININGSFTPSGTQDVNVTKVAGTAVEVGQGASSSGSQRVVANISVAGAAVAAANPVPVTPGTGAVFAVTNAGITSIDSKTPALGQALAAASVPVVLTAAQVTTLTPQTDALTNTQLRASAVPISIASGNGYVNIDQISASPVQSAYGAATGGGVMRVAAMLGVGTAANSSTNPVFNDQRFVGGTTIEVGLGTPSVGSQRVAAMLGIGSAAASAGAGSTDTATQRVVANIQRNGNELDYDQGTSGPNTLRVSTATGSNPNVGATPLQITSSSILPYIQDFSSVNLTTTYTQLIASVGLSVSKVEVFNGSGTPIYLSTGAAASEVVQYIIPPGGSSCQLSLRIPVGSRIAIRTHTGTISSGYFIANFFSQT